MFIESDKNVCIQMLFQDLESSFRKPDFLNKLKSLTDPAGLIQVNRWEELCAIIIKVKELRICRRLLRSTVHRIPCKWLVDLVKEFGWTALKEEIKTRVLPCTLKNAERNCELVNVGVFNQKLGF